LPTDLVVPQVTINEAVAHSGSLWVDTTDLTMTFALPVGAPAPAAIDIAGDVASGSSGAYSSTATAQLTPGDGEKTVRLSFADAAGNFAPSSVMTLHLDTTAPTNAVVVSPPALITGEVALPDVYVNADNLAIPFALQPEGTADDFDAYVYSIDGGVTWNPTPMPLVLSPLAKTPTRPCSSGSVTSSAA
jgi:hypothetical protein